MGYDCRNFPRELELAPPQIWEAYDFDHLEKLESQLRQHSELEFEITPGTEVGGLLLWMSTDLADGITLNTRTDETSWNQYFLELPKQRVGSCGRLTIRSDVDATTEDVKYKFTIGSV